MNGYIARIVDMFSKRLQIQERLSAEIADTISEQTEIKEKLYLFSTVREKPALVQVKGENRDSPP